MEDRSKGKSKKEKSTFRSKKYSDNKKNQSGYTRESRNRTSEGGNEFNRSEKQESLNRKPTQKSSLKKRGQNNFDEKRPDRESLQKKHYSKKKQLAYAKAMGPKDGILRLNKYISNTGECSRREADKRIEEGRITVNGEIVKEVGTKVKLEDKVCMDGKLLQPESKVYLVLNKPKDFVTTLDDPLGRKTVIDLIKTACKERVYPVGRLDRMTTGVLLFTNDGDMTKRLTHPSYNKKKIYHVFLDRAITQEDLDLIASGLDLEDGFIRPDAISYADAEDKTQVGIEIHSGKNRIVRRIFEHLDYTVEKLDRVFFAGITKKNLPRGRWRFLTKEEIWMLKNF